MRSGSPKILLVALPFAGGSSYSYNFLRPLLPPDIVFETLEYPGRGTKTNTALVADMATLIEALLVQYQSFVQAYSPHKIVLYGHSIGAVVGSELLHVLHKRKPGMVPAIGIFSGHGHPRTATRKKLATLSDNELVAHFEKIGSLSKEVLAEPDLITYILPILRNDLQLHERHNSSYLVPVPTPLAIINGKQDNISETDIESWRLETSGTIEFYQLEGHHFFISQYPKVFSDLLIKIVQDNCR